MSTREGYRARLETLYFSQASLKAFRTCPRKFRYRYLDGLFWPRQYEDSARQAAMERGEAFHTLAQRYYAGLPCAAPGDLPDAEKLTAWLEALKEFAPREEGGTYFPEQHLRMSREELRLQARYDLIRVDPSGRVTIYDWKTEAGLPKKVYLQASLQTVLYLYLFVEAGGAYVPGGKVSPENVSLVYWNPQHPASPLTFGYTAARHSRYGKLLRQLTESILALDYEDFTVAADERVCQACEYHPICFGRRAPGEEIEEDEVLDEELLRWEDVPEIPY
ncbi:MAG: PD-(D/E)XK nuclease family protein [Bacillota bacterium]